MTGTYGRGRSFNIFIAFNFFVAALLGIVFLCCKVFETVRVGSSPLAELPFRHAFHLVRVVRVVDMRVAWLVYARTYCVPRGGRDEVWVRETMFSQLARRSPCVVVSG